MSEPRYVGGQAVMEGVMMRGAHSWAVAVRLPDGTIETRVNDAPQWADRWSKVPGLRGIATLVESMSLGMRALTWSANKLLEAELAAEAAAEAAEAAAKGEVDTKRAGDVPASAITSHAVSADTATVGNPDTDAAVAADAAGKDSMPGGWAVKLSMAFAMIFFIGVFMLGPALLAKWIDRGSKSRTSFTLIESVVRLVMFLGYLWLIGRIGEIKKVFRYHGAEHKAIALYETGRELTPEASHEVGTEHVRCGTNFLLTVMVVTIVVHTAFGRPALPLLIASRIIAVPLVAAVSYELIRAAAKNMRRGWVRAAMKPGLLLQKLTTREPTDDEVEVAIVSLKAVLSAEELAEVDARPLRSIATPRPAFGSA